MQSLFHVLSPISALLYAKKRRSNNTQILVDKKRDYTEIVASIILKGGNGRIVQTLLASKVRVKWRNQREEIWKF